MGSLRDFDHPASISFNITETVDENEKDYTIHVPTVGSERAERDQAVLVFRFDMMEVGAIFMTIKNPKRPLLVRNVDNNQGSRLYAFAYFSVKKIGEIGY